MESTGREGIDPASDTSAVPNDDGLREYSSAELDQFVADDRLTGRAAEITEQATRLMEERARS